MTVSVIIPIGDREVYATCRASLLRSITAMPKGLCDWDIVEVFDDARQGVAWARNEGLRRAKGEYVAWIDCDDTVTERWATAIAEGVRPMNDSAKPVEILVFDAMAEWEDGRCQDLTYGRTVGLISADEFAVDVIGAGRIGSWLWNKVLRRGLFAGRMFVGKTFEDYRMLCEVLPYVKVVRYLPEMLYVYHRRATGMSQYVNRDASRDALCVLVKLADARRDVYAKAMRRGVAIQAADFCRHAGGEPLLRAFIRRQLWNVLRSKEVSGRVKVKCLLEALKP